MKAPLAEIKRLSDLMMEELRSYEEWNDRQDEILASGVYPTDKKEPGKLIGLGAFVPKERPLK